MDGIVQINSTAGYCWRFPLSRYFSHRLIVALLFAQARRSCLNCFTIVAMPGVPDYENRSEEEVAEASQAGSQVGLFNELIAQLVQVHQQALSDQAALREEVLRLQDPSDGRTKSEESSQIPPSTVNHPKDAPDVADDLSSSSGQKVSPVEDQVQGARSSAASMTSMTSMITRPPNQPPKFPIRPGWLKEPKHSTVQRHRQTTYDLEGRSSVVDGDDDSQIVASQSPCAIHQQMSE